MRPRRRLTCPASHARRVKVIHELRELVEQKEQFIALMSHELRTPVRRGGWGRARARWACSVCWL